MHIIEYEITLVEQMLKLKNSRQMTEKLKIQAKKNREGDKI